MYESQALDVDYIDIDEYVGATPKSSGSASAFWTLPPGSALPKRQPSLRCWDAVTAAFTCPGLSKKKSKKNLLDLLRVFLAD